MKCLLTIEIQSLSCVITNATGNSKFEITDTKLYEPVVSLSTKNSRLVQVFIKSNGTSSKLQALSLSLAHSLKAMGMQLEVFLDYPYFKEHCKTVSVHTKQQVFSVDRTPIY